VRRETVIIVDLTECRSICMHTTVAMILNQTSTIVSRQQFHGDTRISPCSFTDAKSCHSTTKAVKQYRFIWHTVYLLSIVGDFVGEQ